MIKSITMKCFRKHTDKTIDFKNGLNIIRGCNEAGKSTIYEAILYALFGSSALKESIADVVSVGYKESQLKTVLTLELDHEYVVTRSTAGAEIYQDGELLVTGQTATRTFMEEKLGCTMQVAQQLMFAKQSTIKGVLSENGAANSLVETLANLGQIETLVDKIQDKLPSGSLVAIDQQIASLEAQVLVDPIPPSDSKVETAKQLFVDATSKFDDIVNQFDCETILRDAHRAIAKAEEAEKNRALYFKEMERLDLIIGNPPTLSFTEEEFIATAKAAENELVEQARSVSFSKVFPEYTGKKFLGDSEDLEKSIRHSAKEIKLHQNEIQNLKIQLAATEAQLINESVCGLCKKDLTDVPEVVDTNNRLYQEIEVCKKQIQKYSTDLFEIEDTACWLSGVQDITSKIYRLADEHWKVDGSKGLPPAVSWVGSKPLSLKEATAKLDKMKKEKVKYEKDCLEVEVAKTTRSKSLEPKVCDVRDEVEILERHNLLKKQAQECEVELQEAKAAFNQAESSYHADMSIYNFQLESKKKSHALLAEVCNQRADMIKHNALIKKLRELRPQLAAKMWNTLQGGISHYFSAMRQEESSVERTASGFTVNGRSIKGLSGSTEDVLGLAIRMALSKLFIPWVPFLLLDESFSACDTEREMAGIGVLASSGFQQTILITHSDAPESMADHLIYL